MPDDGDKPYLTDKALISVVNFFDRPTTWFHETFVKPYQKKYPYYHRRFRRVPTVDQCEVDDMACVYEANLQYKRDKEVDAKIIMILKNRYVHCNYYEGEDVTTKCAPIHKAWDDAATNYFIKYGDLGHNSNVVDAYMKQKHRLIWERRKQAAESQE